MRRPQLPANFFKFSPRSRLKAVQQFICSFEYKHTSQTSFNVHKFRPLVKIIDTAKMMIYAPQPIKCVEAVFLAVYLTSGLFDVERIPLGFKTLAEGQVHQHIVLLVRYAGKFGAFGISRLPNLMNKELEFDSISSIVGNFVKAYQHSLHTVLKIRVGLPVEHNVESCNYICWRSLSLDLASLSWPECCEALEKHAAQGQRLWKRWLLEGRRNGHPSLSFQTNSEDNVTDSEQAPIDMASKQVETLQTLDTMPLKASKLSHGKKFGETAKRQLDKIGKSALISVHKNLNRSKITATKKPLVTLNSIIYSSENITSGGITNTNTNTNTNTTNNTNNTNNTTTTNNNNNNKSNHNYTQHELKKGLKGDKATISNIRSLKTERIGSLQISGNTKNPPYLVRKKRTLCTVIATGLRRACRLDPKKRPKRAREKIGQRSFRLPKVHKVNDTPGLPEPPLLKATL